MRKVLSFKEGDIEESLEDHIGVGLKYLDDIAPLSYSLILRGIDTKGLFDLAKIAYLFHDSGKPYVKRYITEDKKLIFYGHELVSAAILNKVLKLKENDYLFSNRFQVPLFSAVIFHHYSLRKNVLFFNESFPVDNSLSREVFEITNSLIKRFNIKVSVCKKCFRVTSQDVLDTRRLLQDLLGNSYYISEAVVVSSFVMLADNYSAYQNRKGRMGIMSKTAIQFKRELELRRQLFDMIICKHQLI